MIRKFLTLSLVVALLPWAAEAKPGRSYSSGRSSFSPSRSSSSSSSRSSSSGKSYSSGSGRTYSSGSSASKPSGGSSAGRSYSSGSAGGKSFFNPSSSSKPRPSPSSARQSSASALDSSRSSGATLPPSSRSTSKSESSSANKAGGPSSSFSFDTAAARAQKEATSKRDFSTWKQSQASEAKTPVIPRATESTRSYSGSSRQTPPLIPDAQTYRTRTVRVEHHYAPYYSRPLVGFNDSFNGFFWWWLLDRSLNERAQWAYHHRADMDGARYQALLAHDTNLEARVKQLEAQQTPVNRNYVPQGLDRDLMYSDEHAHRSYVTRPTTSGRLLFWFIMVPAAAGTVWFFAWLVFFKRWQTAQPRPA